MIVACGIQIEAIDKSKAVLPGSSWPRCLRLRLSRCDIPNPASECILQCWAPDWDSGVLALTEPNEIDLPDVLNGALIEVRSYDRYTHELFASERTRVAFIAEMPLRAIMQPVHRVKTVANLGPVDVSRSLPLISVKMLVGRVVVLLGVLLVAGHYLLREQVTPPLAAAPGASSNAPSLAAPLVPAEATVAGGNYAVLAAKARLHDTPALGSSNVVGEYVLGTRFSGRAAAEGFVEAHMDNGRRGFFDARVVGDAGRVERLIREPAQALANLQVLRSSPINAVALRYLGQIQSVTLFDNDATASAFEQATRDARSRVVGDEVTARYFYYQGLLASDAGRTGEAERHFSAAVRANPLDERAVQQWGLFQGAHKNHVDPLLAAHAVLLNSDSATAWILVALSLPEHDTLRIIKVLKQAITASSGRNASQDPITTRQFLQQLKDTRATSGLTRAIDAVLADRMLW